MRAASGGSASAWALRAAAAEDLAVIVAIENEAFPRPWPAAIYNEELRRETTWLDVAQGPGGEVLAFLCAWRILDACHLLRIATREAARGQGIGRALVEPRRSLHRGGQVGQGQASRGTLQHLAHEGAAPLDGLVHARGRHRRDASTPFAPSTSRAGRPRERPGTSTPERKLRAVGG